MHHLRRIKVEVVFEVLGDEAWGSLETQTQTRNVAEELHQPTNLLSPSLHGQVRRRPLIATGMCELGCHCSNPIHNLSPILHLRLHDPNLSAYLLFALRRF